MMPRDDDAIDRAVDAVARELTSGEPGSDFRAIVMARIARQEGPSSWWPAIVGLASAAVILAVVLVARHDRSVEPRQPLVVVAPGAPMARVGAAEPIPPRDGPPAPPPTRSPGAATMTAIEPAASAVAALAPPPLSVDSLAVAPLDAPDSIHLEELPVPSIDIPALPAADPISQGEI